MPESPDGVAALAEKASNGDGQAFERLVHLFHQEIFRMVYYRTRSRMDAEDLTQEIFTQAFKGLSRLGDFDRFRPWLFTIAVNRVRDFRRKKRLLTFLGFCDCGEEEERLESEPDHRPGALDELIRKDFWEQVKKFSESLSPVEREVFFLRFLDGLALKEIALVLKKSESAVKTHLYRAIKKFKEDSGLVGLLEGEIS